MWLGAQKGSTGQREGWAWQCQYGEGRETVNELLKMLKVLEKEMGQRGEGNW